MIFDKKILFQVILIVVLLLVTVCIVHLLLVKANKARGGTVVVHGTYVINVDDGKFTVNGMKAPKIQLRRGVYYEFKNECDEPLYFSTDSHGGHDAPGNLAKHKKGFKGLSKGTIFFIVTDDIPDRFYYQSGNHSDMGGEIHVL